MSSKLFFLSGFTAMDPAPETEDISIIMETLRQSHKGENGSVRWFGEPKCGMAIYSPYKPSISQVTHRRVVSTYNFELWRVEDNTSKHFLTLTSIAEAPNYPWDKDYSLECRAGWAYDYNLSKKLKGLPIVEMRWNVYARHSDFQGPTLSGCKWLYFDIRDSKEKDNITIPEVRISCNILGTPYYGP